MLLLMWRKDKYYVLHGMTLNWWFTLEHTRLYDYNAFNGGFDNFHKYQ